MRVITGKAIAGRVVVEGKPLAEGSTVTVLAPEPAMSDWQVCDGFTFAGFTTICTTG